MGGAIRGRLAVTFVNAAGAEEAGLDHGGLQKAFLEEARACGALVRFPCVGIGFVKPYPLPGVSEGRP